MVPSVFLPYLANVALLKDITKWTLLKEWAHAKVYRALLADGSSVIVKWGGNEMASEGYTYTHLVQPLHLPSPYIHTFIQGQQSCLLVLEDLGSFNLEQKPDPVYFFEAARTLANLRATSTANMNTLPTDVMTRNTVPADQFLHLLYDITLKVTCHDYAPMLKRLQAILPQHLELLYNTVPLTIVHHDFVAKNLMINREGKIIPIDWSISYFSPHLGDLYCLIRDAKVWGSIHAKDIEKVFLQESKMDREAMEWQLTIGGLCWLIKTLRWLVYGGTDIIPGSEAWVPDLLNEARRLSNQLTT